ncbi:glycosyltransferase [Candidatus Pantoea formicae]|uniref:glycosyltransferase n=1 Tax=Candidatus Pantoea formicae TaxID=2608355 RepID=UPI003ED95524
MNAQPLVSIIVTAQIPHWLNIALQSARDQNYGNCEIIVADYSDDKSVSRCVKPWLKRAGHSIKLITTSSGYHNVVEQAISVARGTYFKFLSDAELLAPDCISKLLAALKMAPRAVIAVSKRNVIDAQGNILPDTLVNTGLMAETTLMRGQDLLRYQTTLDYNLLGELVTSLIPREGISPLMGKKGNLFILDGNINADILALVLYSKLLQSGDVVWLPEALCSIRHSEVYIQPHQRESKDNVKEQRKKLYQHICSSEWYKVNTAPREQVTVANIAMPHEHSIVDLRRQQQHNLSLGVLNHWLKVRKLESFQHEQMFQIAAQQTQPFSLSILIDGVNSYQQDVLRTLKSLSSFSSPLLKIQPVIISATETDEYFETPVIVADNFMVGVNQAYGLGDYQWLMCTRGGTEFHISGLIALSTQLQSSENYLALYADEFFMIQGEPAGVAFRPDFNLDMLLSTPRTMAQHWLYRRELLVAAEGFDASCGDSAEFDLILKLIVSQGLNCVGHITEPLVTASLQKRDIKNDAKILQQHLHHRGYSEAEIDLDSFHNYRLRYNHAESPKVSVVILASGSLPVLISCLTSIMEKTSYKNYELLIVTDNQYSPERDSWLQAISEVDPQSIRVLNYENIFNRSAMANLAAKYAKGEYLILMNYELAVTDGTWLANLLNHGQRPEVAVVGGKQLSSDNKVRHAGYVLGINGAAGEVFRGQDDSQPSAMARLHIDQNYSAVSGDFMLVRKTIINEVGGFNSDNRLFDDVDFCLKIRERGYLIVWTPYARILRSAARRTQFVGESLHATAKIKLQEEDKLFKSWLPIIARDPAYNSNLSLRSRHYDISNDSKLNWNPINHINVPKIIVNNADSAGCGYYRMLKPFAAMKAAGFANGYEGMSMLTFSELAQFNPDTLVIQRRYSPAFHNWIERVAKLHKTFKVFELDDYIIELPAKHNNRANFRPEVTEQLRKSLSYFDRFVVSTAPLAEALHGFHPDIQVVQNLLPVDWWGNLHSLRNQGRKPRVGWAGGSSHQGDLEMIADVVKALANEVEWVFMGMCPDALRPFVHEFHRGVDITLYPAALEALNLDLALAPVEDNIFNVCKSNLRLMEYGACGIPVICSDVECYRHTDLPVTRVKNRFKDWVEAIRMHLTESEQSEKKGLALQAMLRKEWMLKADAAANWLTAWRP